MKNSSLPKAGGYVFHASSAISIRVRLDISCHDDIDDIEQVSSLKYLGVIVDENLKYKEYMYALIGKLNRSIGIVRRASRYVDQVTLVLPNVDYL